MVLAAQKLRSWDGPLVVVGEAGIRFGIRVSSSRALGLVLAGVGP